MNLSDFDYDLPLDKIAQTPLEKRDQSKLLVMNRENGQIQHRHFNDLVDILGPRDVLVRNNTRVIPARLFGIKKETQARVEVLILKNKGDEIEALVGNAKVVKQGTQISFGEDQLIATCTKVEDEGIRHFHLSYRGILMEVLERLGQMPLPPYIHKTLKDKDRYQTVYAKMDGSAAAPTAGLHFTEELTQALKQKGVEIIDITLHVGLGTFRPVKVEKVEDHTMHSEDYVVSLEAATALNKAKAAGKNIIGVGTTTCRVLETQMARYGTFKEEKGSTDIFIKPSFEFKAIDSLITNFHLPKSTLLMLVSAFSSREHILHAYQEALTHDYRFFSFGDAMYLTKDPICE